MDMPEAISRACAEVGIEPPRGVVQLGRWVNADTLGKHGKGDGRIICDEQRATAFNWQTGAKATVWLAGRDSITPADRAKYAQQMAAAERKARERADAAAAVATTILQATVLAPHRYLMGKGFGEELVQTIRRDQLAAILEAARKKPDSLITDDGRTGLVIPARHGAEVRSVQIIWEDGAKKFLAGGAMDGATHRIAKGRETWLCEGYATGLSLRAALRGLHRSASVLVCFSASNIAKVAASVRGPTIVAADNDKPLEQFGGLGTGEHYARQTGLPYIIPPDVGADINDMHQAVGIFAVQRLIGDLMRRAA